VAHTACVYYDSCTGQHKLVHKGVSGQNGVVIWFTNNDTMMCVRANQSIRL